MTQTLKAGALAWLLPGAGHFILGHRGMGIVFFVAITFPYLAGAAIGGVKESINPRTNPWLFLAELGVGSYTGAGFLLGSSLPSAAPGKASPYVSYYPESDVAQIYLATAGLLNVLAIVDALARAQTGGLPTYARELAPAAEAPAGSSP